jgi:hypothetical protein
MNIKSHPIILFEAKVFLKKKTLASNIVFNLFLSLIILSSCTSQEERMKRYKEQATLIAWEQEKELVDLGSGGTRKWSEDEKDELVETGKVDGYKGRYIQKRVENNFHLATSPDNIVFFKKGENYLSKKALQKASLRSYLLNYEKNKYALLGGVILSIAVVGVAFKKQHGMIIYPAIVGAVLGAIRLGVVSKWSIMATLGGLATGLIMGTLAGLFIFLVIISVGVG